VKKRVGGVCLASGQEKKKREGGNTIPVSGRPLQVTNKEEFTCVREKKLIREKGGKKGGRDPYTPRRLSE